MRNRLEFSERPLSATIIGVNSPGGTVCQIGSTRHKPPENLSTHFLESIVKKLSEQSLERTDTDASSRTDMPVEINFEGIRSAITPINLMFDGTLFKDVKGLSGHVTNAMKKVAAARPDFHGALNEINQLEATFKTAVDQWERKLSGEIQRLKTTIEKEPDKSLGATKKINKYQAELNSGRGSIRSMPSKISQVRNQLLAASGKDLTVQAPAVALNESDTRFSKQKKLFPVVYRNSIQQILRKAKKLSDEARFYELALALFKNVSKPIRKLGTRQIHQGVLYYLHHTAVGSDVTDVLVRQKAQFVVVTDVNETGDAYVVQSVFPGSERTCEIPIEAFEQTAVDVLEPLEDKEIVIKLLKTKFKDDDFKATFNLYHLLRQKALEDKREEKFNPKQEAIHQYLTGPIFDFVGIAFELADDEIRFVGAINKKLQSVV